MQEIKDKKLSINTIEILVFTIVWLSIFSIPYLVQQSSNTIFWEKILSEWLRMGALLLLFLINIIVLVPRLLFAKKYLKYTFAAILLVLFVNSVSILLQHYIFELEPVAMPKMELGPGMPPMELGSKMPAPMGFRAPVQQMRPSLTMKFVNSFLLAILVMGASIAFKLMSKWLSEENLRKDAEKEQLKSELAFLRHQVSPHFFMNTLNNIHALIDINTETAKDAVIRLSTLMRYLLYETSAGHIALKKEIDFIESYISLMRLRYSNKVAVTFEIPANTPDVEIPPMLFVSLLENAFKHGVSYQADSYIAFSMTIVEQKILCVLRNSKHKNSTQGEKKYSGIGLSNIKKSLDLLFQKEYSLLINETETDFEVQLTIPLYENKMFSH
ncbi:MAG: hypothetical protein AUK44_05965 [Porphyromonadaceae bacterium CG2_30_38_12]|nr:MAG: hypothetical protein AUK44_05965 [Porphyromonadaceae bacterium CG2_30_38_12]